MVNCCLKANPSCSLRRVLPLFQVPFALSPRGSPAPSAPSSREHFCLRSAGWEEQGMLRTATQREPGRPPEQQTSSDLPSARGARLAHPRASAPDSVALHGLEPELLRYAGLCWERRHETRIALCVTWPSPGGLSRSSAFAVGKMLCLCPPPWTRSCQARAERWERDQRSLCGVPAGIAGSGAAFRSLWLAGVMPSNPRLAGLSKEALLWKSWCS